MVNITELRIDIRLVRPSHDFSQHPGDPHFLLESVLYEREHRLFHCFGQAIPHLKLLELTVVEDDRDSTWANYWEVLGRPMFSEWLMEMKELEVFV